VKESVLKALSEVSVSLGIDSKDLYKLIDFETAGTWNPLIKNKYSSARGLIQFTDATARSLGYKDSLDLVTKNDSIESQLYFPVLQYLSKFKPFPTKQSLYMSVFYPVARQWPLNKAFPDTVQKSNPGIKTVQDYVNKVEGIARKTITPGLLALIGLGLLILFSKGKV
jgi:hypothetical protein